MLLVPLVLLDIIVILIKTQQQHNALQVIIALQMLQHIHLVQQVIIAQLEVLGF